MLNICVERPMSLHCNSDMCMFTGVSSKFSVIRVFSLSFVQFNARLVPHSSSQHGASHYIKTAKIASYPDLGGLAPESVHCFGGACDLVLALCWSMVLGRVNNHCGFSPKQVDAVIFITIASCIGFVRLARNR